MTVAWVTSFSNDLYEATGKGLIKSFEDSLSVGKLFVAPERVPSVSISSPDRVVILPDPADDPALAEFVSKNKDIIPKQFGGDWTGPCSCLNPNDSKDSRHKPACPGAWFCKHSVRWFRKILALRSLLNSSYAGYSHIFWLDSDVLFKGRVTEALVRKWFNSNDLIYFKGPKRKVWETGILGMRGEGIALVNKVFDYYMSGEFRKSPRWDDSYAFQTVSARLKTAKKMDLATGATKTADVIPFSPLKDHLEHNKGTHGRKLGLMV